MLNSQIDSCVCLVKVVLTVWGRKFAVLLDFCIVSSNKVRYIGVVNISATFPASIILYNLSNVFY